ncbi:MAG TPA: hypothetical protein VMU51_21095 [Mycobacteriales bacterium]|nr:hypothetical protein [Mycobacteriales bacterium]
MDRLVLAACRQGFAVTQSATGLWLFHAPSMDVVIVTDEPRKLDEWIRLLMDLCQVGLVWSPDKGD